MSYNHIEPQYLCIDNPHIENITTKLDLKLFVGFDVSIF